ncbi:7-cyano-7-deazaguanine synthase in queuosine biosynthesis [Inquilinus ginsengisoli]|uniref:7-cyano-7-deazaguanine synthase n=1 Tax=Inquilinus ginsengisoli TaxID=363840 RepID=UPI003D22CFE0
MTDQKYAADPTNKFLLDAIEPGVRARPGAAIAVIGRNLEMSIAGLKAYFFAEWQTKLVDLLVVAAAAEYCDVVKRRPALGWARTFDVRVAVHDPSTWRATPVKSALEDALHLLTGDNWSFTFVKRISEMDSVRDPSLSITPTDRTIMPYSDGIDSKAVAEIVQYQERGGLVRVRLGSKGVDRKSRRVRFTTVPYEVNVAKHLRRESSARSRGFKFSIITGIAAHLAKVNRIIVTESGQGSLGPILACTGHSYPDYRVHPTFTKKMEQLFTELMGSSVHYEFPRIWKTKGETIGEASALPSKPTWHDTRSCWQQSRQTGIAGRRRQCGICAACLLRRMSMHAAGQPESQDMYVWEDLTAREIRDGAAADFKLYTSRLEQYAIAGVLHLDHLAALPGSPLHARRLRQVARETARALGEDVHEAEAKLIHMLECHRREWCDFLRMLGPKSFVTQLASVLP